MKKSIAMSLVAGLMSFSAFAAQTENTGNGDVGAESATNLDKYKRVVIDESAANRENKKYTINASIIGSSFNTDSTSIEVGYHLTPDDIITLQFTDLRGDHDYDSDSEFDSYWDEDGKGSAISVGYKKFVSNSFYIKPELYKRSQTIVDSVSYSSIDGYSYERGEIEDIGASFKIGNQWQWENFTLGCDWVGLTRALSVSKKKGNYTSDYEKTASLLNFYLGATF